MDFDRVAPGVYRLGDDLTNFYLVDDTDGTTLIDAGLPAHYDQVVTVHAAIGRTLADLRAILLTHGHLDHTGVAERLRRETGAEVWIHRDDAKLLTGGSWRPQRSLLHYAVHRPASMLAPLRLARHAVATPPIRAARRFIGTGSLPVPGRPEAIHVPGHTRGSCAYLLRDRSVLFTGDALVTSDVVTSGYGPRVPCAATTGDPEAALASLDALAESGAGIVLPGHGAPFLGTAAEAVAEARLVGAV